MHKLTVNDFNPHSRTGSDNTEAGLSAGRGISIHTPARGVTSIWTCNMRESMISIHTPARGVTRSVWHAQFYQYISIHTPARGVTVLQDSHDPADYQISIHTPARGVTVLQDSHDPADYQISIHTPARGVTHSNFQPPPVLLFQSTLPHGE